MANQKTRDNEEPADLGVPEFVILGLLAEGDSHAYELHQTIETREIRAWVGISFPSIYRVARELEERGLVSSIVEEHPGRPNRKLLSLTEAGRAALHANIRHALASDQADRALISLALMFGRSVPNEELCQALREMVVGLQARLDQLTRKQEEVKRRWSDLLIDGIFGCERMQLLAMREWAEEMCRSLESAAANGPHRPEA